MTWAWLFYIVPALLGLAALATIGVICIRKIPKLSALDLEAMPVHRQMMRKSLLVEDRLARKISSFRKRISGIIVPVVHFVVGFSRNLFKYLKSLEDKYKKAAKQSSGPQQAAQVQSAALLVQQAQVLQAEGKYSEAEKKYIEAIARDNTFGDAYRGLAQVYVEQKDMEHAIETMKFLRQLNPQDEAIWRDLGKLYKSQAMIDDAFECYEQAVELNPNNPKNLDALVEVAILAKKKYKAQTTLDKLKEVNPENKKLQDYQKEIDSL